jgi:hypothetical protein
MARPAENVNNARLESAHVKLQACQAQARQAYDTERKRFAEARSDDHSLKFTDWMLKYAVDYAAAWEDLQAQLRIYRNLLDVSTQPLGSAMDMMLSANAKLEHHVGNNMPCSAEDLGPLHSSRSADERATLISGESGVYYRPLYSLAGYDRCVDTWTSKFDANAQPTYRVELDFEAANRLSWTRLGFPSMDAAPQNAMPQETSDPPTSASIHLFGVQAFDVERGFWNFDINPLKLRGIRASAENAQPVMKITRILCSYKVKIKASFATRPHDGQDHPTVFDTSPTVFSGVNNLLEYDTRNDAVVVPQLLAVLAKEF